MGDTGDDHNATVILAASNVATGAGDDGGVAEAGCRWACPPPQMRTSVMLVGMPMEIRQDALIRILDQLGLHGLYDMVYVPVDLSSGKCLGHAFVNMVSPHDVPRLWLALDGFSQWGLGGADKPCSVRWSEPDQGLDALVERYRLWSAIATVPPRWKPDLFYRGCRVPFPEPTQKIMLPNALLQTACVMRCLSVCSEDDAGESLEDAPSTQVASRDVTARRPPEELVVSGDLADAQEQTLEQSPEIPWEEDVAWPTRTVVRNTFMDIVPVAGPFRRLVSSPL